MSASRVLAIIAAVAGACLQCGCASHKMRDGIWELSFAVERGQNHLEFPLDPREVRIRVEADDKGEGEIVQISSVVPAEGVEPMYGDLRTGVNESEEKTFLQIDHTDDDWHWRMYGEVRDPETVLGRMFFASARQYEDTTLEGRWGLEWRRDG